MGFFDNEVNSSFDSLFDLNRDGVLDSGEQVLRMNFIMDSIGENESRDSYEDGYGDESGDSDW